MKTKNPFTETTYSWCPSCEQIHSEGKYFDVIPPDHHGCAFTALCPDCCAPISLPKALGPMRIAALIVCLVVIHVGLLVWVN